ncbi:trypsin-like peptidase domain-containing protein [Kitasatospora sp. MAP5-34]|uniref:S1C family serine protease n=1 Tax=Kitasatospora sp. MAP5-34 TaxID=3035102 RepID=UPI002473AB38|nr:trypsin-like peptidase domain-containing protein [Kitasatospora sp. MAP5-34]MDH6576307.1 putative serine protease PepD [Kitasatospora sp. MAP5-34]
MSTEHASGSTGPEEHPSAGQGAVGPAPDAASADAAPVVESAPTLSFSKLSDAEEAPAPAAAPSYLDAPPPVLPAAPVAPAAPLPPAAPTYADAPAPVSGGNPYAAPATPVAPPAPPTPGAPTVTAEAHHPFGAGQPLGGWGSPPGGTGGPGDQGYPADFPGAPGGAPRKKRGGLVALIAAVALVAGIAGGAIGVGITDSDSNSGGNSGSSHTSTTITVGDNQKAVDRSPDSIAGIAAKALPSVVTIKASNSQESGTGTGFVFDTEGHILTNNHVVAPAAAAGGQLSVKFSDGSSYSASVVGRAQGYDVAVIKLDNPSKEKLVPLPLGDSDNAAVGDATIAIGAPYGLEGTVTSGIVSAKDRPVASGDDTGAQSSFMNALQTDASINPGNSGGPLLNASGAVIGINSAIQSNTSSSTGRAGSIGLGFAIPINQAKRVAQDLIKTGTPVYAIFGVLRNDNYTGDGAQIQTGPVQGTPAVTPGGPADLAGLKAGDVITKLGNHLIDSGPTLVSEIWTYKPGDKVPVEYTRDGKPGTTTITLGERKGDN